MPELPVDLLHGLACAALEPNLRRLLLFDADFTTLQRAATTLAEMLTYQTEGAVRQITLPSTARDDALWGQLAPVGEQDTRRLLLAWQQGLLTQDVDDKDILLVVIPDLSLLTLTVVRTCIMLMDTPVAHLQRHGQDKQWQPRLCWVAGCSTAQVGRVTHHLLDRFALRLPVARLAPAKSDHIGAWLDGEPLPAPMIPADLLARVQSKPSALPTLSPDGIAQLLTYFPSGQQAKGMRRELALARLSRALAYIDGQTNVTGQDVEKAAKFIHLSVSQEAPPIEPEAKPDNLSSNPEPIPEPEPLPEKPAHQPIKTDPEPTPTSLPEAAPIQTESQPVEAVSLSPYPEDEAAIERDVFPLQMPMRRHQVAVVTQGAVLGVQTAQSLTDLAFVPTVLEALPYQQIRQARRHASAETLIILPNDLRCYRRVPPSEYMLLLLLDYTSLTDDCLWQEALLPHLRWAYVSRAMVVLIQVGQAVSEPSHELRAQRVMSKTVLTPLLLQALEAKTGRATPLAHGLEMAYQTVMQSQQHGRSALKQTRFILITDGRGNVPLEASQTGVVQRPVRREGIEDALTIAYTFRGMKRVIPILLDPQPEYHAELPLELAEALGAIHEPIPLKEWEGVAS